MLKVVLDTNIFISGILVRKGNPSIIIKAWKRSHKYQLFITEEIIQEILRVMRRLNISEKIVNEWEKVININAIKIFADKKVEVIKDDPTDNKFLDCAKECQADYIVSGDKHLKNLNRFEKTHIVNPKEFLKILMDYKKSNNK